MQLEEELLYLFVLNGVVLRERKEQNVVVKRKVAGDPGVVAGGEINERIVLLFFLALLTYLNEQLVQQRKEQQLLHRLNRLGGDLARPLILLHRVLVAEHKSLAFGNYRN